MPNSSPETECHCGLKANLHKKNCTFQKYFRKQFIPRDEDLLNLVQTTYELHWGIEAQKYNVLRVCCCCPEIPHDETQKFLVVERDFEREKQTIIKNTQDDDDVPTFLSEEEIKRHKDYDKKVFETPIFENRREGLFTVQDKGEVNNQLKQTIEPNMLVGRSMVIREIVNFINYKESSEAGHHRIMHIFGPDGLGKSDIANFATKYALSGRFLLDGAIYVNIEKKESKKALIQTLCKKLSVRFMGLENKTEFKKEDIERTIFGLRYIIIIDQCSAMIKSNKQKFSKFIQRLIDTTQKPKYIIISQNEEDLDLLPSDQIVPLKIEELTKLNAAKLMLKVSGDSKHLKSFKDADALSKHQIFDLFPLRPDGIVQIALLLKHKSLQDIVEGKLKEKQDIQEAYQTAQVDVEMKISVENQQPVQPPVQQEPYDEYSLVMKFSFEELLKKFPLEHYPNEYALLYIICQMPSGLFERDIDEICRINKQTAEDWRRFFGSISDDKTAMECQISTAGGQFSCTKIEKKVEKLDGEEAQNNNKSNKNEFKFLTLSFYQELEQIQYIPIAVVRPFITKEITTILNTFQSSGTYAGKSASDYFNQSLKYLSILSRKFLRLRSEETKNEIDHKSVTAAIDLGIWHDDYQVLDNNPKPQNLMMMTESQLLMPPTADFGGGFQNNNEIDGIHHKEDKKDYLVISSIYEPNYKTFLDIEFLKQKYQTLNYLMDDASGDIQEISICVVSYLIECNLLIDAAEYLKKSESIAEYYGLTPLKGKLILLKISLEYKKRKGSFEDVNQVELNAMINQLKEATQIFRDNKVTGRFKDAMAESHYLQSLILIQICFKLIKKNQKENNAMTFQASLQNNSNIPETASFFQEKSFDCVKITDREALIEMTNARKLLASARLLYDEGGIQFGVAKTFLVETEFILDLIYDNDVDQNQTIEKSDEFFDSILKNMDEAIKIFNKFQYKGLVAKAQKQKGLLWYQRFRAEQMSVQNEQEQQSIASFKSRERVPLFEEPKKKNEYYPIKQLLKARDCYEQAVKLYQAINDIDQVIVINELMNQILEKIQANSHNVLIFAKSFPLVEDLRDQIDFGRTSSVSISNNPQQNYQQVGILSRYHSDFRKKMAAIAQSSRQIVNVKFDILNREVLEHVRNHGCKLLHLSSHVFYEDKLALEGQRGLIEVLTQDLIIKALLPTNSSHLNVDLVVLAMPISNQLAETFLNLGVTHVVTFGYETIVKNQPILIPQIQTMIYTFCCDFYQQLLKENKDIHEAFASAVNQSYEKDYQGIIKIYLEMELASGREISDDIELLTEGAKLWPEHETVHKMSLFQQHPKDIKGINKKFIYIDSSKKRRPNIFYRFRKNHDQPCFTGRRVQLFEMINSLTIDPRRLINICGPQGIGKSQFLLEVLTYLNERDVFKDGIIYLDMKTIETIDRFKDFIRKNLANTVKPVEESQSDDFQHKDNPINQILALEHLDDFAGNRSDFDSNIINLINIYPSIKVIIMSRAAIPKETAYESIKDLIEIKDLPPLNDEESFDLIRNYCQRKIYEDLEGLKKGQIGFGDNRQSTIVKKNITIEDYIKKDQNFETCCGFPLRLHLLAKALDQKKMSEINMKSMIGDQKIIQEMSQYKHKINRKTRQLLQKEKLQQSNDMGSPKFVNMLNFPDHEVLRPSLASTFVEFDSGRLRKDSLMNQIRGPDSSKHSLISRHLEEEEKKPGELQALTEKEEKEQKIKNSQIQATLNYPKTAEDEDQELRRAIQESLDVERQTQQHLWDLLHQENPTLNSLFDEPFNRAQSQAYPNPFNMMIPSPALSRVNSTTAATPVLQQTKSVDISVPPRYTKKTPNKQNSQYQLDEANGSSGEKKNK